MINYLGNEKCNCGKFHTASIDDVVIERGAINKLPNFVQKYNSKKPFVFGDINTFRVVGQKACDILCENKIEYTKYVFNSSCLEPDEYAVGSLFMHFDSSCDLIIAVGSGVINDLGKILGKRTGLKFIIVGTAPSMDGYASATSSMNMDGVKVSLSTRTADVIIGDIDVLKQAPITMLKSGIGDMLAKYVSITEWRISHIINGEYYCEKVANLVRLALKKCVDNIDKLMNRNDDAIKDVFEGLIISGLAMTYANVSRPASGVEHYFSHILDMRGLEFSSKVDTHGIQCALGTLISVKLYEMIKGITPNKEKALYYVEGFNENDWNKTLKSFLGKSADTLIELEKKERKYDKASHKNRLEVICNNWDNIIKIIEEELPSFAKIDKLLDLISINKDLSYLDVDSNTLKTIFKSTKDIRDKYVLSRLAWDLGILDELVENLNSFLH